ncbi:endoplasmic reticulum calcium transporter [Mycosarcoma maydis]|uniref:Calcium-transporting ATPase n=1 Tax=Mycosarcoma maydis TaxID=5270 RepID=A0A0D1DZX8_MYCMD|nr:endoplasmic reticulum calcium transporter [Ustilago maydis 521]KIS69544.1 endoplasmic reticulum calcium transporter [Ustilago maydis 521]|eukprot:XP_011388455.1 endoplasmic reticulum calcium transporter [Ustilago maydis 521]
MEAAWTKSVHEALTQLRVNPSKGLSATEVEERRAKYGSNTLPEQPPTPLWQLILDQFKDQLVLILLASAVISFVLALLEQDTTLGSALIEPGVIFLILIANATVGVVQERNADKAIDALKEYSPDTANVIREGSTEKVRSEDLVPGDILILTVGDKIPADCRLIAINSSSFRVDQAILTGESISVNKTLDAVPDANAVKQDQVNILFSGTTVANGTALAVVALTGTRTAIGDIHAEISKDDDDKTPLKQKLDDFGELLAKVITVICILVWIVNFRHFNDPSHHGWVRGAMYYFKIAVALAVAAIPEGLAAVITACLALGTKKMAKKNAIVRHLPSVETLGSTNVICSDKTGTLTTNQMSVTHFSVLDTNASIADYSVSGTTFAPVGEITDSLGKSVTNLNKPRTAFHALAEACSICNDSHVHLDDHNNYTIVGQPTEAALKVLVEKLGHHDDAFNATLAKLDPVERTSAVSNEYGKAHPRLLTFEFSRDRKSMSTLIQRSSATGCLLVKGAPETVVERCDTVLLGKKTAPLDSALRAQIDEKVFEYGRQGLRTLAIAIKEDVPLDVESYRSSSPSEYVQFEQRMTLVGLVGMLDPPRPEVRHAIQRCRQAGIRVIVITGDNKNTAETICRQIGVFGASEDLQGKSFTGREFDALTTHQQKLDAVSNASLFSRVEPSHKSQLVDLLQSQGLVVAMTGDGVNDAPALKKADIGIAMGSGTDVAKLAADMVLADDNFATIEAAVQEGRSIFNNMQSFIRYLISSNIGEVVSIFLTVLLGLPEALIPVQLLWVNLVTDGLPATALGFNPPSTTIMREKPRSRNDPLISGWIFTRYLLVGAFVGAATIFGYAWWFLFSSTGPQISYAQLSHFHQCSLPASQAAGGLFDGIDCSIFSTYRQPSTIALSVLVVVEMFNALNAISETDSLLTFGPWKNPLLIGAIALSLALHYAICTIPFLQDWFQVTRLTVQEVKAVVWISAPVVLIEEVCKLVTRIMFVTQRAQPEKVGSHKKQL